MKAIRKKDEKAFKKAYYQAIEDGHTKFTFKDEELLVSFARQVLEYLKLLRR